MKIIHRYKYGSAQITGYKPQELNGYWRLEIYASNSDGMEYNEKIFCTGSKDISERHSSDNYSSICPCCFLGFGHTIDYHNSHNISKS